MRYNKAMSVKEIEKAIAGLPPLELADLAKWFEEFQEDAWDRQIAQDVKAGVLRRSFSGWRSRP